MMHRDARNEVGQLEHLDSTKYYSFILLSRTPPRNPPNVP